MKLFIRANALNVPGRAITKIVLGMKMTALLLTIACLQVSAKTVSQTITLAEKNTQLEVIFKKIEKQSGYFFIYQDQLLKQAHPVTIEVKDAALNDVLEKCFAGQPVTYSIVDRNIIVKKRNVVPEAPQPPVDVKGRVVDESGEPIAGVAVSVKRNNRSVITDANGEFSMTNVNEIDILVFNSVAFEMQEISIGDKTFITIRLIKRVNELDQTVVIGYGQTTRRMNTGNVSRVTSETIERQPVANPLQALQGRVPGMMITQGTGVAGGRVAVQIRGQNSIANGNDPLYIVDGVPFTSTPMVSSSALAGQILPFASPLHNINPLDIESIEILKDADATAIYGSRGANGVILITTKKGVAGKTQFDISFSSGVGRVSKMMDLLNTKQYLEMRREAFSNDNVVPTLTPGTVTFAPDLLIWDTTHYTNWQKELIGGTAQLNNLQATLSGGSAGTQFLFSTGYRKETTVFPGNFSDQKASAHLNVAHQSLNQKFRATVSVTYVIDRNLLPVQDMTSPALQLAPNSPEAFDETGNLNWGPPNGTWTNPYSVLLRNYKIATNNLVGNTVLSYQIIDGLYLKTSLGYTTISSQEIYTIPRKSLPPSSTVQSSSRFGNNFLTTWIAEPQIDYKKTIGKGQLSVLIGTTFQENTRQDLAQTAEGFISDGLLENILAASSVRINNYNYSKYKYNAVFGRIGYDWKQKYLLNITGRRDGSSRFGPGRQFANFGAIGTAWIFSKEPFVEKLIPALNYGKIRFSYGTNGNDQLTDYLYLDTYTPTPRLYQGSGLFPSRLFNADFAWEVNNKLEAALELSFWNDRLFIAASYFRNRSSNQLVGYPLPFTTGFTSIQYNLPAKVQNQGLEIELSAKPIKQDKFQWEVIFNLTILRNKLIDYPNLEGSSYATTYEIGKSLFLRKRYHYLEVDAQTGIYRFLDVNNDGNLTTPADILGLRELAQDYYGGIQNIVTYRNWQLDFLLQFIKQPATFAYVTPPGFSGNQPISVLDRWQKPGDVTNVQKFTTVGGTATNIYVTYFSQSDGIIVDASFIRLKNVNLSYRFPEKIKKNAAPIRAYVQAQNLLTITSYPGTDPETKSNDNLPPLKMVVAGLKITI